MVDEHFGINIVEYMAAGLIPVTNKSGGPYLDIAIKHPHPESSKPTGIHCKSVAEYAQAFNTVFSMSPTDQMEMRQRARQRAVNTFSGTIFEQGWANSGVLKWLEIAKGEYKR